MTVTVSLVVKTLHPKSGLLLPMAALAVLSFLAGCGGSTSNEDTGGRAGRSYPGHVLSTGAAKQALLDLPYAYTFRKVARPKGAQGALAGRVVGAHHTVLNFGIAFGRHAEPVSVPHAGISEVGEYPGFVFTDDELVPGKRDKWEPGPQFHTAAQWKEVARMSVAMVEQLCRASTHQPCPVGG